MATYVVNRLPTAVLNQKTPYEVLHGKQPDYSNLKTFGCLSYVANVRPNKGKFDPRAEKCIFLGFNPDQKEYRLYSLDSKNIIVSRDVSFYEQIFPFKTSHKEPDQINPALPISNDLNTDEVPSVTNATEGEPVLDDQHQINENDQHEDIAQPHDDHQHVVPSVTNSD